MLKLSLALLVLAGSAAAQDQHSIEQLQGTSRILIVFAPNADNAAYTRQLQLIERHSFELSSRNLVVVPVSTSKLAEDRFAFENLPVGTASDMNEARTRFHVRAGDFMVILVNENGAEQIRSASPVDIHVLTASLDSPAIH